MSKRFSKKLSSKFMSLEKSENRKTLSGIVGLESYMSLNLEEISKSAKKVPIKETLEEISRS
jgi:hypothetical protein